MKRFQDLTPREVLTLAIDVERQNAGRLETLADLFTDYDAEVRALFLRLRDEELDHGAMLERAWTERFGNEPRPAVGEIDVEEVVEAVEVEHGEHAIFDDLKVEDALRMVRRAEEAAHAFYVKAAERTTDETLRRLYQELADMENNHIASVSERTRSKRERKDI